MESRMWYMMSAQISDLQKVKAVRKKDFPGSNLSGFRYICDHYIVFKS